MVGILRQDGSGGPAVPRQVPLWIVGRDDFLVRKIRDAFQDDRLITFEGWYRTWQAAADRLNSLSGLPPPVCVVDRGGSKSGDFRWLPIFRNLAPAVPVVLLMDGVCDEDLSLALSGGVVGLLGKPFTIDQVLSTIRAVAEGQVAMSPAILDRIGNLAFPRERSKIIGLLTDREKQILTLIVEGCSTQEIADRLFISYFTVDTHLKNIFGKLEVKKRSSLVALLLREHIIF